jgi:hypothetical protein
MQRFFILFLLLTPFFSNAQDCKSDFFPYTKGMRYSFDNYDKKGKLQSSSSSEVLSVTQVRDSLKATIKSQTFNEKGKEVGAGTVETICAKGLVYIDLRAMLSGDLTRAFKDGEVTVSGTPLEMPSKLSPGQTLPGGDLTMSLKSGGIQLMKMTFVISNRKVETKESITLKAGTFEAYKISYDMEVNAIISRTIHVVQWMAPGVGLVKSENYDKNGKSEGWMELSKFGQ